MDTQQTLLTRRSVRRFTERPVSLEALEAMIDAARLAPTARNEQPWEFVAVSRQEMREKIAQLATHGKFIAQAPLCIAVFCRDTTYYLEDGAAATQNILLAAWAQGIASCWVAGDKKPYCAQISQLLGVPEGYRLVSLVALGYPAEKAAMPRKRTVKDVLHAELF